MIEMEVSSATVRTTCGVGCGVLAPADRVTDWDVTKALFTAELVAAEQRRLLLSDKALDGIASTGPIVCACFGIGRNTICDALKSGAAHSHLDLGAKLKASTNCGS